MKKNVFSTKNKTLIGKIFRYVMLGIFAVYTLFPLIFLLLILLRASQKSVIHHFLCRAIGILLILKMLLVKLIFLSQF